MYVHDVYTENLYHVYIYSVYYSYDCSDVLVYSTFGLFKSPRASNRGSLYYAVNHENDASEWKYAKLDHVKEGLPGGNPMPRFRCYNHLYP